MEKKKLTFDEIIEKNHEDTFMATFNFEFIIVTDNTNEYLGRRNSKNGELYFRDSKINGKSILLSKTKYKYLREFKDDDLNYIITSPPGFH